MTGLNELPVLPTIVLDKSTAVFDSDEAVQEKLDAENTGKYFDQGHYELKIVGARFNKVCADKKWQSLCVTLGTGVEGDDREIRIYPLIPITQNIEYQKPGGKKTMFCWSQTIKFLKAISESPKASELDKFQTKFIAADKTEIIDYKAFSEQEQEMVDVKGYSYPKLIGKTFEVDLGYLGYYISKVEDSDEYAVFLKGKIATKKDSEGTVVKLTGNSYDDCLAVMTDFDIEDKLTRLEVVRMYPGKVIKGNSDLDNL